MESYRKLWYIGWEGKRCYQCNMCIGMGVATGLCAVAAMIVMMLSGGMEIAIERGLPGGGGGSGPNKGVPQKIGTGEPLRTVHRKSTISKSIAAVNRWPTGGFIERYTIIPDVEVTRVTEYDGIETEWLRYPEMSDVEPGVSLPEGPGYGFGVGDGDDSYGMPEDEPFMPPVRSKIKWPESGDGLNLGGISLSALIEFTGGVRWPWEAKISDTGYVTLAFTIDEKGRVGDWEVIRELPPGKGFAGVMKDYLIFNCRYHARKVGGVAVPTRVKLDAMICWECMQSMEVTQGDLAVKETAK